MTVLDATARERVARHYMREVTGSCAFTKPDVPPAVAATDQWVEDNIASFNSALPTAFRTTATAAQKAELLMMILMRRMGRLRVAEDS